MRAILAHRNILVVGGLVLACQSGSDARVEASIRASDGGRLSRRGATARGRLSRA